MTLTDAEPAPDTAASLRPRLRRRWRPGIFTVLVAVFAVMGASVGLYPSAASWFSSVNQAQVISDWSSELDDVTPSAAEQLYDAREYNQQLSAGAVLAPGANVPAGTGDTGDTSFDYNELLTADATGIMGRIRIESIDVDLPIYHGTSDATLLRGAGHLEGSHLPVGGDGTHSVITAHRGLADATMFTNLNQVVVGDTFTVDVLGEVLTYRVRETKVVSPEDTDTLRAVAGDDLVTLVTCTPLGINTQRILVTGERITPTPIADIEAAALAPVVEFPWWAVAYAGALVLVALYLWRGGYTVVSRRPAA